MRFSQVFLSRHVDSSAKNSDSLTLLKSESNRIDDNSYESFSQIILLMGRLQLLIVHKMYI